MITDPDGLRRTLRALLDSDEPAIETGYVLGAIRGVLEAPDGDDTTRLADVRDLLGAHRDVITGYDHGLFSTCPPHCARCATVAAVSEASWTASLAAQGIELVAVSTLSPEERDQHAEDEERAWQADEQRAAAGYPDPCERHYDAEGNEG